MHASFFSNLKRKNQKWTFINVHFLKIQNTFEKNDSLHFHPSTNGPPALLRFLLFSIYIYKLHATSSYGSGAMRGGEMESVRPPGKFGEMEYLVFFGIH